MKFRDSKFKTTLYNLRCNYCGTNNWIVEIKLLFKLIKNGEVYHQCKECGRLSRYVLIYHIAHDSDTLEKDFNRDIENKVEIWRLG